MGGGLPMIYCVGIFFLVAKTIFAANSQSSFLHKKVEVNFGTYQSSEMLRKSVLRRNSEEFTFFKKNLALLCIDAIEKNIIIDDFFNCSILHWKDEEGLNLLHYAALNKRPCIAVLLLALEKFYKSRNQNQEKYISLIEQKNKFGFSPKDVAFKSLEVVTIDLKISASLPEVDISSGLRNTEYFPGAVLLQRIEKNYLSYEYEEERIIKEVKVIFLEMIKEINSLYHNLLIEKENIYEDEKDILLALDLR